jgi:hypothetical protein
VVVSERTAERMDVLRWTVCGCVEEKRSAKGRICKSISARVASCLPHLGLLLPVRGSYSTAECWKEGKGGLYGKSTCEALSLKVLSE